MRIALFGIVAATIALAASPSTAGPAHVLVSQTLRPAAADGAYAVSADLDPDARRALVEGLRSAGFPVARLDQPHAYLVSVQARAWPLCSAACSSLVRHDDAPLSDYFRHGAVVAAQVNPGERASPDAPVAWYTVLQSDGLSERSGDYLPALLRYGARAYGQDMRPQAAPRLTPAIPRTPGVFSTPGA